MATIPRILGPKKSKPQPAPIYSLQQMTAFGWLGGGAIRLPNGRYVVPRPPDPRIPPGIDPRIPVKNGNE